MKRMIALFLALCLMAALGLTAVAESDDGVTATVVNIDAHGNITSDLKIADWDSELALGDVITFTFGATTFELPFVSYYYDVDVGQPLAYAYKGDISFGIYYDNFAATYGLAVGDTFTLAMHERGAYQSALDARLVNEDMPHESFPSDEAYAHFADAAVGAMKQGILYRSASPVEDDTQATFALALMEEYGIAHAIDISSQVDEISRFNKGYNVTGYYKDLMDAGNVTEIYLTTALGTEDYIKSVQLCLRTLITAEKPILMHDYSGYELVGDMAAIIQALAGATCDEIMDAYVAEYAYMFDAGFDAEKDAYLRARLDDLIFEATDISLTRTPHAELSGTFAKFFVEVVGLEQAEVDALIALFAQ